MQAKEDEVKDSTSCLFKECEWAVYKIENLEGSHVANYTALFANNKMQIKRNYGIFENLLNSQK